MKILTSLVVCAGLVAGCTSADDRILFDGQYFNAKVRKVEKQRDVFTVAVKPVSKSLDGALQAGVYGATVYCVNSFGSSDIIWTAGPDVPQSQLNIVKDVLTLQGRCPSGQ
ncbi:hypothetical protein GGR95_001358 [Sulfitobacter undariae]|uniref:Lipoprotein n=1 Tax=Sulfitobacter undariae TaxID=1563671 RepID=A0A7W6E2T3_9RHOB|nr:hypothetical protein [Sulfitobacter undariae]MBB3993727.1 hypothetical protein [Sulfitobacter undariae]